MTEFQINKALNYYALSDFAKGYVEAMFFTNGDIGAEDDEHRLNRLGTKRLIKKALQAIRKDCEQFCVTHQALLEKAYESYTDVQAGRDFWFSRQRHGCGFWDREELKEGKLGYRLHEAAEAAGECYVETWRGWIYVS